MMHCYMFIQNLSLNKTLCKHKQKKTKSACNWVGCTIHMGSATRIYCIVILSFLFLIAQDFVLTQNSYEHVTLRHLAIHIFVWFFVHILMYWSTGAPNGMGAQDTFSLFHYLYDYWVANNELLCSVQKFDVAASAELWIVGCGSVRPMPLAWSNLWTA
jgi:hypothetical protein